MEYYDAAMSTGLGGGNATVGMEGFLWKATSYSNELVKDIIHLKWNGYLSDSKQQDARTSFANLDKFITARQAEGMIRGHNCSVKIQSDGCGKQYKSGTHLKTCILLSCAKSVVIDWMVTCAHHGKSLVDALAGQDKYDLRCCLIDGTLDNASVDCLGKGVSEACKLQTTQLNQTNQWTPQRQHKAQEVSRVPVHPQIPL
jgi:hypothetical protein